MISSQDSAMKEMFLTDSEVDVGEKPATGVRG